MKNTFSLQRVRVNDNGLKENNKNKGFIKQIRFSPLFFFYVFFSAQDERLIEELASFSNARAHFD